MTIQNHWKIWNRLKKSLVRNFWARKSSKNGFLTINKDFEGVKNFSNMVSCYPWPDKHLYYVTLKVQNQCSTVLLLLIGVCIWNRCFFIKICFYLNNKPNEFDNQSISHRYLWLFYIFLVTGGFLPNTTAHPLRLTIRRSNFSPPRKNWSAALKVRTASIEISSNQKELT